MDPVYDSSYRVIGWFDPTLSVEGWFDDELAAATTPPSNDKTGSVTGSITFSSSIVGKKSTTGASAGTITLTGAVVGKEGALRTVTGEVAYSGTVAGTKATTGTTASEIVYAGLVVGTKYDPDAPAEEPSTGGGGYYAPRQRTPQRRPEIVRKSGKVSGSVAFAGTVVGRKTSSARTLAEPITYRCEVRGAKATAGVALARITTRAVIRGTGITAIPTTELRRLRDDSELVLML